MKQKPSIGKRVKSPEVQALETEIRKLRDICASAATQLICDPADDSIKDVINKLKAAAGPMMMSKAQRKLYP